MMTLSVVTSASVTEEDLARGEARQQFLSHVRDILVDVPKAEPLPDQTQIGTYCRSLAPRAQKLKMPMLHKVKQMVAKYAVKPTRLFSVDVSRYYPIPPALEKGFMSVRKVPVEMVTQVPPDSLKAVGASEEEARLKKGSVFQQKEHDALEAAAFSSAALRLTNSNIVSMACMRQLLSNVCDQVATMADMDENPDKFDNSKADLELMDKAVVDMDGSNGDLLKLTAIHYNQAQRSRAEAWVDSSSLPDQTKREIKVADQNIPLESGGITPLFSDKVLSKLEKHASHKHDQMWSRAADKLASMPASAPKSQQPNQSKGKNKTYSWKSKGSNQGQNKGQSNQAGRSGGGQSRRG